ncbi:MAG TPA: GNAT family N-acetyltransferase [Micromonosporaceae bacterium]|jgi:GNAT superfamily N-acetyltransferase|nr:GNAT family N-acetyltransferase [Micromonosporaceae bacterium]
MPFARLDAFCDAVPRDRARAERIGPFVLFLRNGSGWPFYARPALGGTAPPGAADVEAVRTRQREMGAPEAFEWLPHCVPSLAATIEAAGLSVLYAPLMVLDHADLPAPILPAGVRVRLLDPDSPSFPADCAVRRAVAQIGFGAEGTARGTAGPAQRDAILAPLPEAELAEEASRAHAGLIASAAAESTSDGVLASGVLQRVGDVAEVVGVATLPAARRRGLGAAVTAVLAEHARQAGVDLVFLAAGSEEIARVYARVGFRRIGTTCIAEP